jgi:hypothetical protein
MISVKNALKLFVIFFLPIMCCVNTSIYAMAAGVINQDNESHKILNHFIFTDQDIETAKKWENYLKESTWFDDKEHQMAIMQPGLEFAASVTSLNDCINNLEQNKKKNTSEWTKDFQKRFNQAYIKKNTDSIKFVMSCMYAKVNLKYCEEQKKEALYREIIYRQAFEDYIRHLQSFSETLDKKERNKIVERLAVAKTHLGGPPYPLQILLSSERERLFIIALNTRKDLDPVLIEFFLTHPFFQKPFDPIKAVTELEALAPPQAEE